MGFFNYLAVQAIKVAKRIKGEEPSDLEVKVETAAPKSPYRKPYCTPEIEPKGNLQDTISDQKVLASMKKDELNEDYFGAAMVAELLGLQDERIRLYKLSAQHDTGTKKLKAQAYVAEAEGNKRLAKKLHRKACNHFMIHRDIKFEPYSN